MRLVEVPAAGPHHQVASRSSRRCACPPGLVYARVRRTASMQPHLAHDHVGPRRRSAPRNRHEDPGPRVERIDHLLGSAGPVISTRRSCRGPPVPARRSSRPRAPRPVSSSMQGARPSNRRCASCRRASSRPGRRRSGASGAPRLPAPRAEDASVSRHRSTTELHPTDHLLVSHGPRLPWVSAFAPVLPPPSGTSPGPAGAEARCQPPPGSGRRSGNRR